MVKTLRYVLGLNFFAVLLIAAGLLFDISPTLCLIVFLITELIFGITLYSMVLKPLNSFEENLDHSVHYETKINDIMTNLQDGIVYSDKIIYLVNKCVNQKIKENSAEILDKQAKLAALQSQINPHFLYNTLETIRGHALMNDNLDIAKMVEALASYFRYSINRKAEFVTLRDELVNIQNYMMILQYRFKNRYSLNIFIDEEDIIAYDCYIPKLILQPVIENAVFHGLEDCLENGKVEIEVIVTGKNLILTVSDNGRGMDSDELLEINQRIKTVKQSNEIGKDGKRNTGIALPNIHKRIQLLFGEEYGINVYSTLNQGTDVEITIPANYERNPS